MENFTAYIKDFITDNLPEYVGTFVYGSELGFTITEEINANGTATFSTKKAMEYLHEWRYDAANYFDYEKSEFGENHNPFDNPESYMVCMIIEGCNFVFGQCPVVENFWNDEIELTEEIVNEILEYVENEVEKVTF